MPLVRVTVKPFKFLVVDTAASPSLSVLTLIVMVFEPFLLAVKSNFEFAKSVSIAIFDLKPTIAIFNWDSSFTGSGIPDFVTVTVFVSINALEVSIVEIEVAVFVSILVVVVVESARGAPTTEFE